MLPKESKKYSSSTKVPDVKLHKRFVCIDPLIKTHRDSYIDVQDKICQILSGAEGLSAIYRVGSIGQPGVSDLDIVCLFDDDAHCDLNVRNLISEEDRYILTHELFGLSRSKAEAFGPFGFFHNFELLWKKEEAPEVQWAPDTISAEAKKQSSLENLIRIFLSLKIQSCLRVIKVRSTLLHMKALKLNLDFLGIHSATLGSLVEDALLWRASWFEAAPPEKTFQAWYADLMSELETVMEKLFSQESLQSPKASPITVSRNISLNNSPNFYLAHNGVTTFYRLAQFHKRFVNLMHRFNQFHLNLPMQELQSTNLKERALFLKDVLSENSRRFPHFFPGPIGLSALYRE